MTVFFAAFLLIFLLILAAVSLALMFLDSRRKKQVVDMLHTAAGETSVPLTKLLKELEAEHPTGFKGLVKSLQFSRHAEEQLMQAGLSWTASKLLTIMIVMAVVGIVLGVVCPLLINAVMSALVFGAALGVMPYVYVRRVRTKRLDKMEDLFPESLDFLARSMRAGHAFTMSLEMVGEEIRDPLGQEFRTLFNEQNLGAPLDVALANFNNRVPLLDVRFFTSSVMLQKQTGGNLSEILNRLSYVIRERFRLKGQVKAASAHGRLTATILTVLPVVTMLGLLVVAPGYLQGMAEDPDGKKLIVGAVIAQILGNITIKKIIKIKV
jgi:tight adherence protein B